MIDIIKAALAENKRISAWTISETDSSSLELFFVRDRLDMNRSTDIREYSVRVYVDFEENAPENSATGGPAFPETVRETTRYRGDASIQVGASDTPEEIRARIEDAVFSAGFVKNRWYDLPSEPASCSAAGAAADPCRPSHRSAGTCCSKPCRSGNIDDLWARCDEIIGAIYKPYPYDARVNSCEIFAVDGMRRVVTSKGTDVAYPHGEFSFELVTDSDAGAEPVEIFNGYSMTRADLAEVERIVDKQLMETDGRSRAVRNEKMENQRVVLSGDAVEEFLSFYLSHATDALIYQNISRAKLGESFLGENAAEKLSIRINPALESSVYAAPVDREGKILSAYDMYEDGVVKQLRTSARYAHYLGIPNIGSCSTFECAGGARPLAAYLEGDYTEILAFSAFQMDVATGDFGGEFRLARQVRNGETRFITGGSISENLFRVQDTMRFSRELENRRSSRAPKAIILDGITIAGE